MRLPLACICEESRREPEPELQDLLHIKIPYILRGRMLVSASVHSAGAAAELHAAAAEPHGRAGAQRTRGRTHLQPGVSYPYLPVRIVGSRYIRNKLSRNSRCRQLCCTSSKKLLSGLVLKHLCLVIPTGKEACSDAGLNVQGCACGEVLATAVAPACAGQPAHVLYTGPALPGPGAQQGVQPL